MVNLLSVTYQSDISDKNWKKVEPHIPKPKTKRGRKREHAIRVIFNAIFYILRSGCQWRMMPHDFPPWNKVYHYFRLWRLKENLDIEIHEHAFKHGIRDYEIEQNFKGKIRGNADVIDANSLYKPESVE